ncbi:MAG: cupin domain-containing protein [Planctomycetota bacterium]
MLVRSLNAIASQPMTMPGVKDVVMRLMFGREHAPPHFAMRRFTVAPGGETPKHAHNDEHQALIVAGQARVYDDTADTLRTVNPGNTLYIPANQTHQFQNQHPNQPLEFICMAPTSYDGGTDTPAPTPGA